jgi:hypothetical protein
MHNSYDATMHAPLTGRLCIVSSNIGRSMTGDTRTTYASVSASSADKTAVLVGASVESVFVK